MADLGAVCRALQALLRDHELARAVMTVRQDGRVEICLVTVDDGVRATVYADTDSGSAMPLPDAAMRTKFQEWGSHE